MSDTLAGFIECEIALKIAVWWFTDGTDLLKWLQRVKNFWLAMTLKRF